ncbi:glycosyltransferase family 4 protein [Enterococcus faecium]|uniref:glycosyltransferase family 4 protein n=1 Tax=Enterococcus TaxID=1350 RepID=UPI00100E5FC1|nr:glycosyltransferase family 4 protein [Enterococcus faecium]EME3494071.1 glycosyltransferase family 4 protein [Enterococcus faecium]MDV7859287.1 glycosyltransferase family 4 protein [Enterococcus faecium]RXW34756.1 glycosyltransferase family 1 protein [Enterococcus faecium]
MSKKDKVLIVGAVGSMIANFNMENISLLKDEGYDVEVAANFGEIDPISKDKKNKMFTSFKENSIVFHQVDFQRGIGSPKRNIAVVLQLRKLISDKQYKFIHTNSPLASALVRVANIKHKTKIIYTAHGFQFFKGGRKRDWLLFYPVERLLASKTDVLITINNEDYERAKKMGFKKVEKIPGVGVDIQKFKPKDNRTKSNGSDKLILLSVGELNNNKNHMTVIEAIKYLPDKENLEYWICGTGENESKYEDYIKENNLSNIVKLLGYRTDVSDVLEKSDIFVFPSFREGLSVSVMEAMAKGKPILASNIRGNIDLVDNNKGGILFNPKDSKNLTDIISTVLKSNHHLNDFGNYNYRKSMKYDISVVNMKMLKIYRSI